MSVDLDQIAGAERPAGSPAAAPEHAWSRLARFGTAIVRQTLVEPVRKGRLRDLDWPYGLKSIVLIGYIGFIAAGLTVVLSGLIRQHSRLIVSATGIGLPEQMTWPLLLLLSFGVACCMSAALHGPWWLKLLGLLFSLMVIGTWSLRRGSLAGWAGWPWIAGALMAGVITLVIIRWRRRFAWWEFAAFWVLIGLGMTVGVAETRYAKTFGTDFNPLSLQQTAAFLGYLVLPAATLAGASVAEITVRATVSATENAQRLTQRAWPYLILAVVIAARVAQALWQIAHRDPVVHGWLALLWAGVLVFTFGLVGVVLLRICRRRGSLPVVSELSDELGRVGFAVAATLIAVAFPVQVFLAAVQVFASVARDGAQSTFAYDPAPILDRVIDPSRVVVGLVLLLLAVRAARRGQPSRALVLGSIGVVLVMLARQLVFGDRAAAPINQDGVNLVSSALIIVAVAVSLLRRRLTQRRALAFAGVLILSALFSYRDFISDPLGTVLGFSGAALVLFGLSWDLLTDSGWGNRESRRFPRPTRVMLVLTNYVLTMTVLAYAALVRDGSTTIYLDPFAELGNLIFGTGLLAAAVVAVLDSAWRDRPI
jgi:hypothetical protein